MFSRVALFTGLTPQQLGWIEEKAVGPHRYPAGKMIIAEGGKPDMLHVIKAGKVKAFSTSPDGDETIFGVMGPGDYFGELAILDKRTRAASVQALTDTTTVQLLRGDFEAFCHSHPEAYGGIVLSLIQCIRSLDTHIEELALLDVKHRIIRRLEALSKPVSGKRRIDYRFTHEEIAAMVGSSRERVSQIMKELTREGFVSTDRDGISLSNALHEALATGKGEALHR